MDENRPLDRNNLVENNTEFVVALVRKMIRQFNLPVQEEDELMCAGFVGLVEAAQRYDPGTGAAFLSYAYLRVRGAVIDHCRTLGKHSRMAFAKIKASEAANDLLIERTERHHPDEHLDKATSLSMGELLETFAQGAIVRQLAENISAENNEYIVDSIEESALSATPVVLLKRALTTLDKKERSLIEGYYFENKSFTQICSELEGVSKSWASRLHTKTLSKLKSAYLEELKKLDQESG